MGFPYLSDYKVYLNTLLEAKKLCIGLDFDISWEANSRKVRKQEAKRLGNYWGTEYGYPQALCEEVLKALCGWPGNLVPGDKLNPNTLSTEVYKQLRRKLTPDHLQYRMGFSSETSVQKAAYLR